MFSLKDAVRKTILAVSLAAVTTSFFTGCNNDQPITSSDLYPPTITAEAPPSLTDDIDPGDPTTPDANTFSIKFKYWYDNPDVQEAQEKIPNPGGDDNGETLLDLAGLPIYTDADGNEYIISGRTPVYLHNGKISSTESLLLRDESGNKVYAVSQEPSTITNKVEKFDSFLADNNLTQATSLDERKERDAAANEKDIPDNLTIYVNNLETTLQTNNHYISLKEIYEAVDGLGYIKTDSLADGETEITLYTAAGFITVTLVQDDDTITVSYSTGIKGTTLVKDEECVVGPDSVYFTPDALEKVLGYDVEVYDNFINIVTDNHDLFSSANIVSSATVAKACDNNYDVSVDDIDPQNPIPESKPGDIQKPDTKPAETQAKPANNKTPDGKYDLADSDIINKDGTYTQTEFDPSSIPTWSRDDFTESDWNRQNERMSYFGTSSNPSKIPYSQITVENAAEAFPFLGYTGYVPDYIQILPSDSTERIIWKVYKNLIGDDASSWPELQQYQNYSSEAEYQQALADEKKAEEEAQRRYDAIEAARKDDKPIGGNLSTEEAWDFFKD